MCIVLYGSVPLLGKHRINVPFITIGVVVPGLCNASSE